MAKKTTRELIGDFIDLDMQLQYAQEDEALVLTSALEVTKKDIGRKLDNIDHFMVDIDRKQHLIDAEIEALKKEQQRLSVRRKATESLKKYFNETLIPMVVQEVGNDGVYETDTARYKLYETYGPVAIVNEDNIPDEYKKVKEQTVIDKKQLRKDLTAGVAVSGAFINKVKRVRRS
jgi:tRNA G37 N-methylase Trm5